MTEQHETTSTAKIPIGIDAEGNTVFWTPREVLFIEDETQALLRVPGKSNVIAGALRDLVWMGRLKLPAPDGEPTP